ncbi:hypothetical protein Y032_0022g602 [Ancylostoma ceylanicum]|uniref:Uncharacterized protein n=1 Tax=Ancylostoma ceylanicum TaxID=53326 RepID=A0A016V0X2_9BILA|nr:hypothetical protein Y032_0022g602 [Ancylostoma ceylanicum]
MVQPCSGSRPLKFFDRSEIQKAVNKQRDRGEASFGRDNHSEHVEPLHLCPRTPRRGPNPCLRPFGAHCKSSSAKETARRKL